MAEEGPRVIKNVFIAYVDTFVGRQIANKFFAMDCDVTGLVFDNNATVSNKLKKVVRRGDGEALKKALLECDTIVYQLTHAVEDPVSALRILTTTHFEVDKRFILVSSLMTWFETPPLVDPAPPEEGEEPAIDPISEDQFNRRIPHVKYQAWRDAEKMCRAAQSERLKTSVIFSGLPYGCGEDTLNSLFKQAWNLAPEGLPIFDKGTNIVPTIHVQDLAMFVSRLVVQSEQPPGQYFIATDDGNSSWEAIVKSVNTQMGNGKTYRVSVHEYAMYDNIEHFVVNLRVEPGQIAQVMAEEDWVCKSGLVENIEVVCKQFTTERQITPLRVLLLGPPAAGKSFIARELSSMYRLPHYTIADIVTEYKYQETELNEEIERIRADKVAKKVEERLDEKRQQVIEERRSARADAEAANDAAAATPPLMLPEDDDDPEDDEDVEVSLTKDEEKEIQEAVGEEDDEEITAIKEKLEEIKKVLASKLKAQAEGAETTNPKDKKKAPAPKAAKKEEPKDDQQNARGVRYSDKALSVMVRWKLSRTECRNKGWVLDGYPKTVRQAKLLFLDQPVEVPEDPEDPDNDMPADGACGDAFFPEHVVFLKATDSFLLERLQKIQLEHPHNSPEDFQRRIEYHRTHFEGADSVLRWLESARTTAGKVSSVKTFDVEGAPLVPPPPPKSQFAPRPIDPVVLKMQEHIGKVHHFGPTPQDVYLEQERTRKLRAEQQAEEEENKRVQKEKFEKEILSAQEAEQHENNRLNTMKAKEKEMLEMRKEPLKEYLMQNVIPVLTKGLIEVCNKRPEDPVDYLAEWLFRHNPEDHPDIYQ